MQRDFRGNLPTERRQQGEAAPRQYAASQTLSSDSNDSQDSVKTQVPLQYFQGGDGYLHVYENNEQTNYNQQLAAREIDQYRQSTGAPGFPSTSLNQMSVNVAPSTQRMYIPSANSAGYGQQIGGPYYGQQPAGSGYTQNNNRQGYGHSMQGTVVGPQYQMPTQYNGSGAQYGGGGMNEPIYVYTPPTNYQLQSSRPGGRGGNGELQKAGYGYKPNVAIAPVLGKTASKISTSSSSAQGPSAKLSSSLPPTYSAGQDLDQSYVRSKQPPTLESNLASEISQADSRLSKPSPATPFRSRREQSSSPPNEIQRRHTIAFDKPSALGDLKINDLKVGDISLNTSHVDNKENNTMSTNFQQRPPQTINLSLMAPGGISPSMLLPPIQEKRSNPNKASHGRSASLLGVQIPSRPSAPKGFIPTRAAAGPSTRNFSSDLSPIGGALTIVRSLADPFGPGLTMAVPHTGSRFLIPSNQMSPLLRAITSNGTAMPDVTTGLAPMNLPFSEMCRDAKEHTWGVIKITNIPYAVNRSEVLAFLGRNAKLISETDHEPVHIVMERVTSKTLDCYVEFDSIDDALSAINRFETNKTGGRGGRLGSRHVEVEVSNQAALMADLFPKAKNVVWCGGKPKITPWDPNDKYNSGFQGFVSKEELVMLVKHVETPQRSPFSKDCPQRPFECLITTIIKYPWYAVEHITIEDRNLLHEATKTLVGILVDRVENRRDEVHLNQTLLKRVIRAALRCPGFTPVMKDDICFIADVDDSFARDMGVPPFADQWRSLWTIGPKPGFKPDVLLWYIAIIREATEETRPVLTLAQRAAQGYEEPDELNLFGNLDKFIRRRSGLLTQTLHEVAQAEWEAIEYVLTCAFTPRANIPHIED